MAIWKVHAPKRINDMMTRSVGTNTKGGGLGRTSWLCNIGFWLALAFGCF